MSCNRAKVPLTHRDYPGGPELVPEPRRAERVPRLVVEESGPSAAQGAPGGHRRFEGGRNYPGRNAGSYAELRTAPAHCHQEGELRGPDSAHDLNEPENGCFLQPPGKSSAKTLISAYKTLGRDPALTPHPKKLREQVGDA